MIVIPAVDIKNRRAVRLVQGRADRETVYDENPARAAQVWAEQGAQRIHIVDLDGAFDGAPKNADITLEILKQIRIEIEIGGGLRTVESIASFMDAGAARCVIGTKALEDLEFLKTISARFPGRISIGIDAKDGRVVTKGWLNVSDTLATELARSLANLQLGEIIYTDIDRDGMLEGPNLKRLEEMRAASPFPLIASGGVTTIDNLLRCRDLGCFGAIVGKAFYDGRMTLPDAIAALR